MKYCPNPACPFREKVGRAAEYEESATTCSDCETALVETEPRFARAEWDEMTPVMALDNAALVATVEAILGEVGIRHVVHNEGVQDLFGAGRIGSGFNVAAGVPVLFVETERLEEAKELLATLETD